MPLREEAYDHRTTYAWILREGEQLRSISEGSAVQTTTLYPNVTMVLTNTRIVLLQHGRPFSCEGYGPDWVLKRSLNADFYDEFKKSPRAFSRVNPLYWWVKGYRRWTWVNALQMTGGNRLNFSLIPVQALAQWGPGQQAPFTLPGVGISVSMGSPNEAQLWLQMISFSPNPDLRADFGSPFTDEYIANLPSKPASATFKAYTYLFWAYAAALAGFLGAGILAAMSIPLWIAVLLGLVIAGAIFRFVYRKHQSAWGRKPQ